MAKYRLMDIKIIISRAIAFLVSYSFLLGIPFFFAYRMYPVLYPTLGFYWWFIPVGLLVFFAALAPVAYGQIRRKMEEALFAGQKRYQKLLLQAAGGMADGVAHQIKNRLNLFSIGSGELQCEIEDFTKKHPEVIAQVPDLKKTFDYLLHIADTMVDNVKRTDGVVRGILNYASVSEKTTFFSQFSLKEIIDLVLDLLRIKHEITEFDFLQINIEGDDSIYGVKAQILECVFNIIDNDYEAILEKKLKISDEEKVNYKPSIKIKLIQNANSSRIEISDNGIGVKEEDKLKIFAPFFTTKSSYKSGAGIGVYVVKRIVEENHQGKIWFASEYMKGTTFYIDLPKKI